MPRGADSYDCSGRLRQTNRRGGGAGVLMSLGRFLIYPLRGQGGVLSLLCAVGLYLLVALFDWARVDDARHLLTVVLLPFPWLITFMVFQHYAWASLSHVAAGHDETIRSIAIEDVSPLTNYLALKVAALLFGVAGSVAASFSASVEVGVTAAAVVGVILPAILGVMILEEQFLTGLDPRRVAAFVARLGPAYIVFAFLLYAGITALCFACVVVAPPNIFAILVASYAFVLGHVLAGRVLYLCRDRLGLATLLEKDPLRVAAVADAQEIDALMVELHRLCGVDHVDRAGKMLDDFLRRENYAFDERIRQRLQVFHDKRLRLEHSWYYLDRLLAEKKASRAWLVLRESLDVDPLFRPGSADALLTLVAVAPASDAEYVDMVLGDVEHAYSDSERVPEALFEHARWLVAKLERVDAALERLTLIENDFPEWAENERFRSFQERVRRLAR